MASKNPARVDVEIFGSVYHVRGDNDPEHLHKLAAMVDEKMREIGDQVSTIDTGKIAILAALNLADELLKCQQQQEGERVKIMDTVAHLTRELDEALQPTE